MTFWQLDNDGQVCGSTLYRQEMAARSASAIQRWQGHPARFVVVSAYVETSARKLRLFSGLRLLGELLRFVILGRRGVRRRDNLSLWYGPRVPDPGHTPGDQHGISGGSVSDRG